MSYVMSVIYIMAYTTENGVDHSAKQQKLPHLHVSASQECFTIFFWIKNLSISVTKPCSSNINHHAHRTMAEKKHLFPIALNPHIDQPVPSS